MRTNDQPPLPAGAIKLHDDEYISVDVGVDPADNRPFYLLDSAKEYVNIGVIKWFEPLGRHCFYPAYNMAYDLIHMSKITDYLRAVNFESRTKRGLEGLQIGLQNLRKEY